MIYTCSGLLFPSSVALVCSFSLYVLLAILDSEYFFGSDVVGLLCHLTFAYRITLLSDSKAIGAVIASVS